MPNTGYTTLTRQVGLLREMQGVANNLANMDTTGYRRGGVLFSEYIDRAGDGASVSMARANVRVTDDSQGPLTRTGGRFDLAIEGDGFFLVRLPDGERLTRAGIFTPNEAGELVTHDGYPLLDAGQAPVIVPPGGGEVEIAADGTVSAGGRPLGRIGLFLPDDPTAMSREGGARFDPGAGVRPVEGATILQGFLESSNVDPVGEIARMVEVQRAYELGQRFLDKEDERIRDVIRTIAR